MRFNGRAGFYRNCGSIDDDEIKVLVQDILEAGEMAFRNGGRCTTELFRGYPDPVCSSRC